MALTLSKPNFAVGNCLTGIHFEGYVFNNKIRPTESHLLLLNSGDSSTMPNYAVNTVPPSTLQTTLAQDCDESRAHMPLFFDFILITTAIVKHIIECLQALGITYALYFSSLK